MWVLQVLSSWSDNAAARTASAELCCREGIAESLYYSWSKEFLEAGKKRLAGDTARQASSSGEVQDLRRERHDLKEALAEQVLENRLLKKSELYIAPQRAVQPRDLPFPDEL